jgi:hypothetical protein
MSQLKSDRRTLGGMAAWGNENAPSKQLLEAEANARPMPRLVAKTAGTPLYVAPLALVPSAPAVLPANKSVPDKFAAGTPAPQIVKASEAVIKQAEPAVWVDATPATAIPTAIADSAQTPRMKSLEMPASISVPTVVPTMPAPSQQPIPHAPLPSAPMPHAPTHIQAHVPAVSTGPMAFPRIAWGTYIVKAYRLIGFIILTLIVLALASYVARTIFFSVNESWIVPKRISPQDPQVVAVSEKLAAAQAEKNRLSAELATQEGKLAAHSNYEAGFAKAIASDLAVREKSLEQLSQLAGRYASLKAKATASTTPWSNAASARLDKAYRAGLIDQQDMLSGRLTVTQAETARMGIVGEQASLQGQVAQLALEVSSLRALATGKGEIVSYDVFKIKQSYELAMLEAKQARQGRDNAKVALVKQSDIVAGIIDSPLLRAANSGESMAFVPYDNAGNVTKGSRVYACRTMLLWCRDVGEVTAVVDGETTAGHPLHDRPLRGSLVSLKLGDSDAATKQVLYVGHKPFGI